MKRARITRTLSLALCCACFLAACNDVEGPPTGGTAYLLRVENVAGPVFPTALSPGVWLAHEDADPLFTEGERDRGEGLEALAEDGDPSALAASLDPALSGRFGDAPIRPGESIEVVVFRTPGASRLSFATMVVESNDVFLAPSGAGIDLAAIREETDVTDQLQLWNAGTEDDEAPGLGPHQAPRQSAPGAGSVEGVIRHFESSTRALPLSFDVAEIRVTEADGTYTLTVENVSADRRNFVTPISPIFWALHTEAHRVYTEGEPAPSGALAELVEIADARALVRAAMEAPGVSAAGVANQRVGTGDFGLARPGDAFEIVVTPDAEHPRLTIATMLTATNDAFLGFPGEGLRLLNEDGTPRSAAEVERDARRNLVIWDAGTELNEVPAGGFHQGPEGSLDDLDDDPDPTVRRYDDFTNDVAGPGANGLVEVTIRHTSGTTFEVSVANRSDRMRFQALLTPFVWIVHDETDGFFSANGLQSPGLVELGEDCLTNLLHQEVQMMESVISSGVASVPDMGTASAPIFPGESFTFEVTADAAHRYFNLASMPYPSNDMFVALEPPGVALLDEGGAPRSSAAIASDVQARLFAWDTGTEANQAGGGGRDNVPLQNNEGLTDVGASEGDGTVRAQPDPTFHYPAPSELVRVTLTPMN
ncbi:MAG: hypothetical protein EVA89_22890 [Sandaracinaceae bacterium]|nr:MAG: hypothetical protein EVA89_22890 [Sandaracinaceae bacterium]